MHRCAGKNWRQLPCQDMLDVAESLLVDEVERTLLQVGDGEEAGSRRAARAKVSEMLYAQFAAVATRDELAKTWGLRPEHQAGLAAAVGAVGQIR